MQISSEDLARVLQQNLKPLYVVFGDGLLLAIETADSIRNTARVAGYSERELLIAENHFKWSQLAQAAQSVSLFADKKIIDLRIPSGKPGVEGAQALQDYCSHFPADTLLLITLPRLDKTTQKSKWFTTLLEHGVVISANEPTREALPMWIAGRLKRQQQSCDQATLAFIADRCEGNLLAAWQEIQKLALLYPAGNLSFDQVKDAVLDVARYDIFKLSEAMLTGDVLRFCRILEGLQGDGTATVLILWALSEEIRTVSRVRQALQRGAAMDFALREAKVWGHRQRLIESAARRCRDAGLQQALYAAGELDKAIKGLRQADVWDELLQLGLNVIKNH